MYKGNGNQTTDAVCDYLDWSYIDALKTMVKGATIYVRGTLLKPNEVNDLQRIDGAVVDGKTCKLMNFRG